MPRILSNEMPWGMHPPEIIVLGIDRCPFRVWLACGVGKALGFTWAMGSLMNYQLVVSSGKSGASLIVTSQLDLFSRQAVLASLSLDVFSCLECYSCSSSRCVLAGGELLHSVRHGV